MSKIHTNKVGYTVANQYDSISFGEQIFVEEMPYHSIPPDYEKVDNPQSSKAKVQKEIHKSPITLDNYLTSMIRILAFSAIGFILYSLFGGMLSSSQIVLEPMGREAGIALGIFTSLSIVTILMLFSKVKIKIHTENGSLHIKSFRGINHVIPLENIADCRINIFQKASSIKTFITSKSYKINLESGLLITFKDGNNLLIASSNTYRSNKNLAYN